MNKLLSYFFFCLAFLLSIPLSAELKIQQGATIIFVGNGLGSRMMNYGHFETEIYSRYPDLNLKVRNMCDEGNTPAFRPHPGRPNPWAFDGAEKYPYLNTSRKVKEGDWKSNVGAGHFERPDEWITKLSADVIIAFFGFNESFAGPSGLESYKQELSDFIEHTLKQKYNGKSVPQLALVSPIAFQDLSKKYNTPNGVLENKNLQLYTAAMKEVAAKYKVQFVDAFTASKRWFTSAELTRDGALLTNKGYQNFSQFVANELFSQPKLTNSYKLVEINKSVVEKNWYWLNWFKIPNGVHVYGRRYRPYGPDNYPAELKKISEMVANRDQLIWSTIAGKSFDLKTADADTHKLPEIKTNFVKGGKKVGKLGYNYGKDAESQLVVPKGYKVELFASEKEFKDLANPCQMSFDNKGRLWVAVMPSYPHYKPGDTKPNDKLLILEDTDNDGKADKQTVFADGLHLPIGFEFAPEGVYVTQSPNLVLLKDTDGDDKADVTEIVLSGFDDHDTHHAISAFAADPSGAFYLSEGIFLHSNIETAYGPVRSSNGGFFRYSTQTRKLERSARIAIPNPWGVAFDEWGQNFFADTSNPAVRWMQPATVKVPYGVFGPKPHDFLESRHRVRPTSGIEFVSSRHFPDDVQGDLLVNNNIGFQGTKQHRMIEDGSGYTSKWRQDLLVSKDSNYRPVDLEFAPDGSLYVIDWHNTLIGHMQHNARDPLRDHAHGRVYRITYPSRPLVEQAKVYGATIPELLENLKLPEFRTRYRTRRELRGRNAKTVLNELNKWVAKLDKSHAKYEHQLLEALWVTWGLNKTDEGLLKKLIKAKDFRARAVAVRVARYSGHLINNQDKLLMIAAGDNHGRVRLEAITAASWLAPEVAGPILAKAAQKGFDKHMEKTHQAAINTINGIAEDVDKESKKIMTHLNGQAKELFIKGAEIYTREGNCGTCHQHDGKGLSAAMFPPLKGSRWVIESEDRLIKLTLNGLIGPIEVKGMHYPGTVPMTPFAGMLNDKEIAAVLTYVRNAFGNKASVITSEKVAKVREATKGKTGFYQPVELLKQHPHKK